MAEKTLLIWVLIIAMEVTDSRWVYWWAWVTLVLTGIGVTVEIYQSFSPTTDG